MAATVVISAALVGVVGLIIRSIYKDKKSGKSYKDIDDLVDFGRPVHIVPHMFRHSFVSVMADKNVSLNVIREFVGHSEDSREIEKIYLHVMQKGKHKIEQAMIDLSKIIS